VNSANSNIANGRYYMEEKSHFIQGNIKNKLEDIELLNMKYKQVFNNTGTAMVIVNNDGIIVEANREYELLTGYTKQELINRINYEIFIHPDDKEMVKSYHEKRTRDYENTLDKYEWRLVDKNKTIKNVFVNVKLISNSGTRIVSLIDLTEKKKIESDIKHRLYLENIITEVSRNLNSNINPPDYEEIIEKLSAVINADKGFILRFRDNCIDKRYISEKDNDSISLFKILSEIKIEDFQFLLGLLGNNRDILYDDLFQVEDDNSEELEKLKSYGMKSLIVLPIFSSGNRLLGIMGFYTTVVFRKWIYDDVRFLKIIRDMLSNYWIKEENQIEIQNGYEQLENILKSTVHALSSIVEIRDPYTAGHQTRVSKLAVAIGEKMKLSKEQLLIIHVASLLHDIGKIKVPSELLTKPGKLSENEFNLIMEHPQIGYDILKEIPFGHPIAEVVLQHHEKLDGSGYPKGLRGDEIFLESKIIAVADVVEAMSSHRPYRPSLGLEVALKEISTYRSLKYDSEIVDICIDLIKHQNFQF
jgi:PAS domain S-box-containing protein